MSRPHAPRALSLIAASAAVFAAASVSASVPAQPTLLDEPPRLYTFKLDDPAWPRLSLLRAFQNAEVERPGPVRRYLGGPWGRWGTAPWNTLSWSAPRSDDSAPRSADAEEPRPADASRAAAILGNERLFGFEPAHPPRTLNLTPDPSLSWLQTLDPEWSPQAILSTGPSLKSNGFDAIWAAPPKKPIVDWRCKRRPIAFMRWGGEAGSFPLLRCDGSVAEDALDRLSIMARPPESDGPGAGKLLPDEPEPAAWERGEWLPLLKIMHPRLLWVLQRVADAFPWRMIYVYSGYRPRSAKGGSHHSLHSEGRAMDISVPGISNVSLLELCRKLDDVGCGFYPNSRFVHVDVRRPGTGHAFWIDASGPGEPSRYVDSWPGVVLSGGMAWDGRRMTDEEPQREGGVPTSSVCSNGPRADKHGQ